MSPEHVIHRAVHDYEKKSRHTVNMELDDLPDSVGVSVKITLYRLIQEALNNGYIHSGGKDQVIISRTSEDNLEIEISDSGPGFNPQMIDLDGHLGLAGMRERIEVLGGKFRILSSEKEGTRIIACLPLYAQDQI